MTTPRRSASRLSAASLAALPLLPFGMGAAGGCVADQDPASYVTGLRVFAVEADPPEAPPGGSTTLTAVAADTQGRPIDVTWAACLLPPLQGQAAPPDCAIGDAADFLQPLGSGLSVTVQVPMLDPSSRGLPDATGGIYLPIRARVQAGADALTAIYRLRLGSRVAGAPVNRNPALTGVAQITTAADGGETATPLDEATPLVVHMGDELTLRASFTPDSAEPYQIQDPGETPPRSVTETTSAAFFATAGSIDRPFGSRQSAVTLKLDKHLPASGTLFELYVVGRDERGGTDSLHRTLLFQ